MAEMDQGLKWLIDARRDDLIAQALPGAVVLGPLPTDVAAEPQRILDTLYRIRFHGRECAVNIEIQSAIDKTMAQRMFEYGTRVRHLYGLPVFSVVLWVNKRGNPPKSPYEDRVGPYLLATWHFINIEVRKLDASVIMKSAGLGLMPLVPMMKGADEGIMAEAMRRVKEEASPKDVGSLALLLTHFITSNHNQAIASAIYGRFFDMANIDLLKDSPLYPLLVEDARAEERRSTLRLVLEGRFGTLAEDMLQALQSADAETLAALAVHAGTDTLEQIRTRLGL